MKFRRHVGHPVIVVLALKPLTARQISVSIVNCCHLASPPSDIVIERDGYMRALGQLLDVTREILTTLCSPH